MKKESKGRRDEGRNVMKKKERKEKSRDWRKMFSKTQSNSLAVRRKSFKQVKRKIINIMRKN